MEDTNEYGWRNRVRHIAPGWYLVTILLVSSAVHCATLAQSPTVWQDEIQTVDYGGLY